MAEKTPQTNKQIQTIKSSLFLVFKGWKKSLKLLIFFSSKIKKIEGILAIWSVTKRKAAPHLQTGQGCFSGGFCLFSTGKCKHLCLSPKLFCWLNKKGRNTAHGHFLSFLPCVVYKVTAVEALLYWPFTVTTWVLSCWFLPLKCENLNK